MLEKRGQLTLFIIAGVVIAVAIIGYFFIGASNENQFFGDSELDSSYLSLRDGFVDCYTSVAVGSLDLVGLQGGYYDFSEGSVYEDSGLFHMPYYYYEGEIILPSLDFISNELGQAVDEFVIFECIDPLEENGVFEVEFIPGETRVEINDNNIHFSTDADLKFSTEGKSVVMNLEKHSVYVDSKFSSMYEVAKFFTESHINDPDRVDIAKLTEMAEDFDLYVSISGYGDDPDKTLILISDDSVFVPNVFGFLNKYGGDD